MGSGFRTFASGEVLTAANVQDYLMDQSVMVFAGTAERGSALPSPETGMTAYSTATGLEVYNGTAWSSISSVVQVKSTTKLDTFTTSSTSFTDLTGLSVSITPTSASNKVLIVCNLAIMGQGGTTRSTAQLVRDSTVIGSGTTAGSRISGIAVGNALGGGTIISNSITFLDSPATISATTYKIQVRSNSAGTTYVNRGEEDTDSASFSRVSSTITAFEVTP
jgi:hypothetical protein